jgi:hypothetical protein
MWIELCPFFYVILCCSSVHDVWDLGFGCVRLKLRPRGEVDIGEIRYRTSFFWRREFQTNAFIYLEVECMNS